MCNCKSSRCICPVSLGLSVGITCAFGVLLGVIYAMTQSMDVTWSGGLMRMAMVFVKGFAFGFVVAAIYDFIVTRCKGPCCRKSDDGKGCTCCGK